MHEIVDESAQERPGPELHRTFRQVEQCVCRHGNGVTTLATNRVEQRTIEAWHHSVTPSFQIAISR